MTQDPRWLTPTQRAKIATRYHMQPHWMSDLLAHAIAADSRIAELEATQRRYKALVRWAFRGDQDARLLVLRDGRYYVWDKAAIEHVEADTAEVAIDAAIERLGGESNIEQARRTR